MGCNVSKDPYCSHIEWNFRPTLTKYKINKMFDNWLSADHYVGGLSKVSINFKSFSEMGILKIISGRKDYWKRKQKYQNTVSVHYCLSQFYTWCIYSLCFRFLWLVNTLSYVWWFHLECKSLLYVIPLLHHKIVIVKVWWRLSALV